MDEVDDLLRSGADDIGQFRREVSNMRDLLETMVPDGAEKAGRSITAALSRASRDGRVQLEELSRHAGRALGEIAAAALRIDIPGSAGSGFAALLTGVFSGAPGRATGGPVSPGRAYMVGERGPELFVPTSSGRVETGGHARGPVNVTVNVAAGGDAGPAFMTRTGNQLARQVRRALERAGA